jgi:NitT/TauT family transport system permease protein
MGGTKAVSQGDDFVRSSSPADETEGEYNRPQGGATPRAAWFGAARNLGFGILGFAILFVLWYAMWAVGFVNRDLMPRPDQIFLRLIHDLTYSGLAWDVLASVQRVLTGMIIGMALAIPAGFALAWYPTLGRIFQPVINSFRAIPPIALSPLVIVYLGIGEVARGSILVYAAFFTSLIVIYESVSAIEEIYIRAARVVGATESEIFRKIVIPLLIPNLFVALRLTLGVCWGTLVAAELLAAERGLGAVIQNAGNYFVIPDIYVGLVCIGAIALAMDAIIRKGMAVLVNWQERVER